MSILNLDYNCAANNRSSALPRITPQRKTSLTQSSRSSASVASDSMRLKTICLSFWWMRSSKKPFWSI